MATINQAGQFVIPSSPTNFTFRPMNKGMIPSAPSAMLPDGSFLDVKGFDAHPRGLARFGGWKPSLYDVATDLPLKLNLEFPAEERIEDLVQMWLIDGTSRNFAITNRCMYSIDTYTGYATVYWKEAYTVASASDDGSTTTIVIGSDATDDYLSTGDYIVSGSEKLPITNIAYDDGAPSTTFTLDGVFTTTPSGSDTFRILKPFAAADSRYVDYTFARFVLYLVDGASKLVFKYAGEYLEPHIILDDDGVTRTVMGARTITYFGERLYFGDIIEFDATVSQNYFRQRIRWTEVLDLGSSKAANYQDLTRSQGSIVKLYGMGGLIMAYGEDMIFYGRQTNLTGLPYVFTPLETGQVTVVGMKAVCSYFDGQLFVGPDNVYSITPDVAIAPIATAISDTLRDSMEYPAATYMRMDPDRTRVLVGCALGGTAISKLFFFNYRTQAWTRGTSQPILVPSVIGLSHDITYGEVPVDDTYDTSAYSNSSYASLLGGMGTRQLLAFQLNNYLLEYDDEAFQDQSVGAGGVITIAPISVIIETPDYDFQAPDENKTAVRLGLTINDLNQATRTEQIRFKVEASTDSGYTWRKLGVLVIRPGKIEDILNFRITGPSLRFRITSGVAADQTDQYTLPYEVAEITLRVRRRSLETVAANTRPA